MQADRHTDTLIAIQYFASLRRDEVNGDEDDEAG